jgi:hypothetical protein
VRNFEPIELENPNTGQIIRLARSYDCMLYDTVLLPVATVPAGRAATLFAGNLNGFAAKTGADEDNLIVSSKLPAGSVALVHTLAFDVDLSRPSTSAETESVVSDILAIRREFFASLSLNGQTLRQLGRIAFYPPWFSARVALGAQATGGIVHLTGAAVEFQGPVVLGAWGSSQIQMPLENARAITLVGTGAYEVTCAMHVTMLNPISEGDGI